MSVTLLLTIAKWLTIAAICLQVSLIAAVIGLKIWLQPFKRFYKSNIKLNGKVALVTGGNSGIGLETVRDLARRGATVVIASRDRVKSQAAVKDLIETTGNPNVLYKTLDLAKFSSIRNFAEDFNRTFDRLDILVNNAGCSGLKPALSEDGIEKVTQINYVGPFLLTNLLINKLAASKPSRIVVVSSKANEFHDFDPDDIASVKRRSASYKSLFKIYANTKLCNVLWTRALAKRLPDGVTVNALHPGLVMTNIFHRFPWFLWHILNWLIKSCFKTAEEGSHTSVYLCIAPELEKVSGEYFVECRKARPNEVVKDDRMVELVWERTMMLIEGK